MSKSIPIKLLFILLWVVFMAGGYFWGHRPLNGEVILALGQVVVALVGWVIMLGVAIALGERLVGGFLLEEKLVVRWSLNAGVGLGILSLLTLLLGAVRLYNRPAAWMLILGLGIWLRPQLQSLWQARSQFQCPAIPTDMGWLAGFIGITLSLTFITALAPDIAWDSHVYHLTIPELFIDREGLAHPFDLPYLGFPQLGEMQYLLGWLLGNELVGQLIHFTYGMMFLTLTAAIAIRYFNQRVAWWSVTFLLTAPSLLRLMTRVYVELTLAFYVTAMVYAFLRWQEGRGQMVWLLGAFMGMAGGVKYTAVATPLAIGACMVWAARREGFFPNVRRLLWVGVVAGILVCPWLVENWVTTGNPVYPFFFDDARFWDAWRGWYFDLPGTGFFNTKPLRLLYAPIEASIIGNEGQTYDATIGPFVLTLGLLLPFFWGRLDEGAKGVARYLLIFLALNYALWLWGLGRSALLLQSRLLLPIFGMTAILAGVVMDQLPVLHTPTLAGDWMVKTLINLTLGMLLTVTILDFIWVNPLAVIVGIETSSDYYARRLGPYVEAVAAINELPADARILFLFEPRTYLCEKVFCQPDALLDNLPRQTDGNGLNGEEVAALWEGEYSHILMHRQGMEFLSNVPQAIIGEREWAAWAQVEEGFLTPISHFGEGEYFLYAFTP